MATHSRRIALFLALACGAACGPFRRGSGPVDPMVIFENQSSDQAKVYAVAAGGQPVRIGTVFPGKKEWLRVPISVLGGSRTVDFVAQIFASNRVVRSGPVSLNPGDSISVKLTSDERVLSVLPVSP